MSNQRMKSTWGTCIFAFFCSTIPCSFTFSLFFLFLFSVFGPPNFSPFPSQWNYNPGCFSCTTCTLLSLWIGWRYFICQTFLLIHGLPWNAFHPLRHIALRVWKVSQSPCPENVLHHLSLHSYLLTTITKHVCCLVTKLPYALLPLLECDYVEEWRWGCRLTYAEYSRVL